MDRSKRADFAKSLDDMENVDSGDPEDAPTPMIEKALRARKKPLSALRDDEIGLLVSQREGFPFILDLVMPMLEANPLFYARHFPGDLLSSLIGADQKVWNDRPDYRLALAQLYDRVVARPSEDSEAFFESLGIENPQRLQ